MKIIRHLDGKGEVHYAGEMPDGSHMRLAGELYGPYLEIENIGRLVNPVELERV